MHYNSKFKYHLYCYTICRRVCDHYYHYYYMSVATYTRQVSRAGYLVNAQQEAHKVDEEVLDEGLIEQRVQHVGTQYIACCKCQSEHVVELRASAMLFYTRHT